MKLLTDLSDVKKTVLSLGFKYENGHYNAKVVTIMAIVAVLTANCLLDIFINWGEIDIIVDSLKGLFIYLFFGICLLTIMFDWRCAKVLIDMIEDKFYVVPFRTTKERLNLEAKVFEDMLFVLSVWYIGRPVYITSKTLPAIIMLIFRLLTTNIHELTVHNVFTTHRYYSPQGYEPRTIYFIALLLQSLFFILTVSVGYVVLASSFVSMYLLSGEMRLMALSIEEMDTVIKTITNAKTFQERKLDRNETTLHESRSLKLYLNYLVQHHQHIYRMAKRINRGIQVVAFYLNYAIAVLMVTNIYVIILKETITEKLIEFLFCIFVLLTSYCYHVIGEEVLIQDDHLRKALYQGPWTDKPQWFKKSLQIIMARATKPVEMRPMGLFVLDMQNFQKLLRSVYTFYNVLSNMKATRD